MGRKYNVDDFKMIVKKFRENLGATISTDVIVGYPKETEKDFKKTLELIKDAKPDIINISRYWARPKTRAAEMKQHPGTVTKQRSRITNELFKKIGLHQNEKWVGWEGKAFVSEKNDDGSYTARNRWYKPIIIKSKRDMFGKTIKVKINKATYYDLRGTLI
jgi:tRNA A37 methylthiotransferase MiaB